MRKSPQRANNQTLRASYLRVSMFSRRAWIQVVPLTGLSLTFSARARADEALAVAAPNAAVGALVAATTGAHALVSTDGALAPTQLRLGTVVVNVGDGIRLPAGTRASRLFLDDARNAPRLGGNIRDALIAQRPDLQEQLVANHKSWTRGLARSIIAWNHALEKSPVRGQRITDKHGRYALLNWAGAVIDPASNNPGPSALGRLPQEPSSCELAAYTRYIDGLIATLR